MAGKAAVPKFGSWDAENIGYTVFFEKVRENKSAPAPAPAAAPKAYDDYDFDPYEHYENLSRNVPSRPASSHGHAAPHRPQHYPAQHGSGYHRRNGSNGSSAASEASSRGSKFSPPRPYQPRYSNNSNYQAQQQGASAYAAAPAGPRHHQHAAPRVAASPPRHAPPPVSEHTCLDRAQARTTKASAVPRFGVWDEQNAAAAGQGFTVQFEKVKRHREVAKPAAPDVPQHFSPERTPPAWRPQRKAKKSFLSKVYRCMFPVVRQ